MQVELTEGRRALIAQAFGKFFGLLNESMRYGGSAGTGIRQDAVRELKLDMRAALGERIPDDAG